MFKKNKNNFSFNIFHIIIISIFFLKFNYISSYITLPLYTLNNENIISPYFPNSIEDIIFGEYVSPFYTVIEIGSPPQKIPLLIELKTNDFVITSVHKMEGNHSEFYSNKTLYNFNEIFNKYNFFNEKNSLSFFSEICKKREIYYKYEEYETAVSEETCPAKDVLYLYQNLDMKKNIKINKANFDLVKNIKDNITGVLGLHLLENKRTPRCFLSFLEKNNITNNFNFFFDFGNPKEKNGKLIIGAFLDELYGNDYKRDDLYYSTAIKGFYFYNIRFNKIYVENNNTLIYNLENKDSELDFQHDLIIADLEYKKILISYIEDLIKEKKCFSSDFTGLEDFYGANHENISFFYCENNGNITDELKKRILPIKLFANEFNNYTFEITPEDILLTKGKYILIKIVFPEFNYKWTLGKPFSLKYKFIFNPQIKQIGFYVKSEDNNQNKENNFWKYFLYILLIIVLIAIFVVLGIILGKKIYGLKRKKRANEMDDDYEYFDGKIKNIENEEKKEVKNYDVIN